MSQSERARLIAGIRRRVDPRLRYAPTWAQLRVWRRGGSGQAEKAELLPELYGGLYDRLLGGYIADASPRAGDVVELSCHPGQLDGLLYRERMMRIMLLGGPGSGKTWVLALRLLLKSLGTQLPGGRWWGGPNKNWLHVGATGDRLRVLWDQLDLIAGATGWVNTEERLEVDLLPLLNGSRHIFKAAKAPSKAIGTPIQGLSAAGAGIDETQNVSDAAQKDVNERGRRAGLDYEVCETATRVDGLGFFSRKLKQYAASPDKIIIKLDPLENPFVEPGYWDRLRGDYTDREWRQRMGSEELSAEHLVYYAFDFGRNLRPRPRFEHGSLVDVTGCYRDITRDLTRKTVRPGRPFVIGHDFGALTSASEVLKAYEHLPTQRTHWWIVDEITSGSHTTSDGHGRKLIKAYPVRDFLVRGDPHDNSTDQDKSDYAQMRKLEIEIVKASAKPISVRHRIAMLNTLMFNGDINHPDDGERRLFIDVDERGEPKAPKFVESCLEMEPDEWGNQENVRKDYRDPTHWPCAAAFGVYPDERFLAGGPETPGTSTDPLIEEAERYRS